MRIVSLNVAPPSRQRYGGREYFTGGGKEPVPEAVLGPENFEGDGQGDRENHGGPDKAVCVYPFDHYAHWERALGRGLSPGAFSENLTVSGALETEVCIGDVFRAGEALVQVSQPRTPCGKLAAKNGEGRLARWVSGAGYTGFYMRVLCGGLVRAGDPFEPVERHPERIAVADVNDAFYGRSRDRDLVERLSRMEEFGADGRALFSGLLARLEAGEAAS